MEKTFQNVQVFAGENFEEDQSLKELIKGHQTALLFPGLSSAFLTEENRSSYDQLILLDGTWKKAKKLYYLNTFLHSLPKVMLKKETPSLYQIRQSTLEFSLSTLEAAVAALTIKEPSLDCSSAMQAFVQMIDFQIEKMGRDVFEKNYRK